MISLKKQSVKGVSWNMVEQVGLQGVRFIFGVILARLLTPADFGLVGMIAVFFAVAQIFIDGGFSLSYIQKETVTDEDANTIFYTNLLISSTLYLLFWFAAPYIARFYGQPQLVELTRVMALVLIINSFNIIQMAQIARAVNFKLRAKIIIASSLTSGTIGVGCALQGMGVWSLAIQQLANRTITTAGFWFATGWRPGLKFSKSSFKELFSFGGWVLLSNIIRTVMDNLYSLIIGKLFPIAQLGYYTKARQFQQMASQNIVLAIGTVSFPVLSRLQHDYNSLKRAMNRFSTNAMFLIIPMMVGLFITAKPFITILLTDKWIESVPFLQLLCLVGIFLPVHMVNVQALIAIGKTRQGFWVEISKNILRLISVIIMAPLGVLYIVGGEVVVSLLSLYINTFYIKRYLSYGIFRQLTEIKWLLIGGAVSGVAGYLTVAGISNSYLQLFGGSAAVGLTFLGVQLLFNRSQVHSIIEMVKLSIVK